MCEKKRIERGKIFWLWRLLLWLLLKCIKMAFITANTLTRSDPIGLIFIVVWLLSILAVHTVLVYGIFVWGNVIVRGNPWIFFFFFGLGGYQSSSSSFCRLFYFLAALIPYSCHLSIRILNIFEKGKAKILYQKMAYVDCFTMLHFFPFFANRIS